MIKRFALLMMAVMVMSGCTQKKDTAIDNLSERIDSLQRVVNQKDNEINDMMGTLNEIQEGIRQVSEAENRVSLVKDGEGTNKTQQIKENIRFIASQMQRNRELVSKLRQQLRESSVNSEKLKATINSLVQQLDAKDHELTQLRKELEDKDIHIAALDKEITSLNDNVLSLESDNQNKAQTISTQDKQLNTAWYVFGTKKELKDQHILEDGKVLQANFNKNYFTKVDIRLDKEIKLYSKSVKLMTNHPESSYTLMQDANKQYVLRITNPDNFWATSKYLVILVK